jgi:hypothetical protein
VPRVPLPPSAGRHPARQQLQTERLSAVTVLDWILVAILALSSACTIALVGKERRPITPGTAAVSVLINVGLIFWIALW